MALWTNEGLVDRQKFLFGQSVAYDLTLRLYTNPVGALSVNNVTADFVECVLSGYLPLNFVPSSWVITVAAGVGNAAYPTITFSFSSYGGGTTIYGYLVTNNITGKTAFIESFGVPYLVPAAGGVLTVQVTSLANNP